MEYVDDIRDIRNIPKILVPENGSYGGLSMAASK